MDYISLDELLPTSRAYGRGHDSLLGLVAVMAVMAISLLLMQCTTCLLISTLLRPQNDSVTQLDRSAGTLRQAQDACFASDISVRYGGPKTITTPLVALR